MTHGINTRHMLPTGDVGAVDSDDDGLRVALGEEQLRVDVLAADLLRLKISYGGVFDEAPTFAVAETPTDTVPFRVYEKTDAVELATDALRLEIRRSPFALRCTRTDGSVVFEDAVDKDGVPCGYLRLNDTFVVTRRMAPRDAIYGLGEKTGPFDRRGRRYTLWNTDILHPDVHSVNGLPEPVPKPDPHSDDFDPYYSSTPFFYHARAAATGDAPGAVAMAGFFVDNGYLSRFEFDAADRYRYECQGGQYTEYVFAGPEMPAILEAFTGLTGRAEVPPLWALGAHQCRFHNYLQSDVEQLGENYRAHDLPCDVLWVDIDYMDGFRVFTWDGEKFPSPEGMAEKMAGLGFRMIAIVDPGVKREPGYAVYDEGRAGDFFCRTESGQEYTGIVWPGHSAFPDFTRADVRDWWGKRAAAFADTGLAGLWNDMNEPATGDVSPLGMRFAGPDGAPGTHPHTRYHNQYAFLMAMATHAGLTEARPDDRPFILTRAGFAGVQRYAAQWTGDNCSKWSHMRMSVAMSTAIGISGQPFVGSDVPGFVGTPTKEMAVRWTQYGALTPFFRFHNHVGELDQYPWSFGEAVTDHNRAALEQRYRLLPYLYGTFVEAARSGAPVMRPLVYHDQHDPNARAAEDIFLLGPSVLVAPVLNPSDRTRDVYLPSGTWIDWATGARHAGRQFLEAEAPLDRIPMFVRGGAVIPMLDAAPRSTMNLRPETLELLIGVPDNDGIAYESTLWEDDGTTRARERGGFVRTRFTVRREGQKLTVSGAVDGDGFPGFARERFRIRLLGAGDGGAHGSVDLPNAGEAFTHTFELDVSGAV